MITGIVCEYNPLHRGHKKQFDRIRSELGADSGIVCLMSGNFVQRGHPAIFDKSIRTEAALHSGADLVLELPVNACLSSAEGFASAGVGILGKFCDNLCFGAENADPQRLMQLASALLSPGYPDALKQKLETGISFPTARAAALATLGLDASILDTPNNILAVEYCKAILQQDCPMQPMPILREGGYHDLQADADNPSATAVRGRILSGDSWLEYVPEEARDCFVSALPHALAFGERAMLSRLRTMTDAEFEALPYGSEGLWRKLMHASRSCATLEEILTATKSKRYTRSRLDRMVLCAFLGLTKGDLASPAPYVRVLGFNDRGREILKLARKTGDFPNAGQTMDSPWQSIENRCGDLYGLFAAGTPDAPGAEKARRVCCLTHP